MAKKLNPRLAFAGFRRGGSSIGFEIVQHLLSESGLRCDDPLKHFFNLGIPASKVTSQLLKPEWARNDVIGCFRAPPKLAKAELSRIRLFLLVRDPRDCQMSWFYARRLHTNDAVVTPINEDAQLHEPLNAGDMFDDEITGLLDWCELSGGCIYRYEDMIVDPLGFIQSFQEFSGLSLSRTAIDLALLKAAFIQSASDPREHHRSGMPYEALRTLPDKQIDALNKRFLPLLERMGYPLNRGSVPPLDFAPLMQRDALKRYVLGLANQNAMRIAEIQRLHSEVEVLRDEIQMLGRLKS
jgi:hypothetical protein